MISEEFTRIQAIASRLWSPDSWWHPGGMAWQLATEHGPESRLTRVWDEAAWGWMYPDVLMLQVDPATPDIANEVVAWFDENNTGAAPRAEVAITATHVIDALVGAGYEALPSEPFGLDLRCAATGTRVDLPSGYRLCTAEDVSEEIRVDAHRNAWLPSALPYAEGYMPDLRPGDGSTFNATKLRRARAMPLYAPERDLVVTTTDGKPAACCTVWLDDATGAAEIEPLGVVPSHRRRGLAQALCRAALDAVAKAGGVEVVIHPRGDVAYPAPRGAYMAAGFREVNRTRIYGRNDS